MPAPKLTKEMIVKIKKKSYRLYNFYYITTKEGTMVRFYPNKVQTHFYNNRTRRDIILKSRQHGVTTFACVDGLDEALFNPSFEGLIIAQDDSTMQAIFDKVHLAFLNHPFRTQYQIDTQRANQLKVGFLDGDEKGTSKSFSSIMVKQSGRSGTFQYVHISEYGKICAKYPHKVKEIKSGTFKAVPLKGRICIESTAEGDTGDFHDMFWKAWNRPKDQDRRPNEFKAFFYNWQWDHLDISKVIRPDKQVPQKFLDYQIKHNEMCAKYLEKHKEFPYWMKPITDLELTYFYYKYLDCEDWGLHLQEYPTTPEEAFLFSGTKFFDQEKLESLKRHIKEPRTVNNWNYYEPHIPGHTYGVAADPAGGVKKDSCAVVIMDFTPLQPVVVATYSNNTISPDTFAYEIKAGASQYNLPLLAVERNNHGHATITKLIDIYPNNQLYVQIKEGFEEDKETTQYGWHTNKSTKPKMFYDIRTAVNDEAIRIPSKQLLRECETYDANKLDVIPVPNDADKNTKHWDLLTALAICYQLRTQLHQGSQPVVVTNHRRETKRNLHSSL